MTRRLVLILLGLLLVGWSRIAGWSKETALRVKDVGADVALSLSKGNFRPLWWRSGVSL